METIEKLVKQLIEAYDKGDKLGHIKIGKKIIKIDPTNYRAYHDISISYAELGEYLKALNCESLAIHFAIADIEIENEILGQMYLARGKLYEKCAGYGLNDTFEIGEKVLIKNEVAKDINKMIKSFKDEYADKIKSEYRPYSNVLYKILKISKNGVATLDNGEYLHLDWLLHSEI
ncbi:MAG: hypothetical protein LBM67_08395 [Lentimicrobiaceae bacterium]|nr:hypothetical protein [Lentimicrobiaceae bacterium]